MARRGARPAWAAALAIAVAPACMAAPDAIDLRVEREALRSVWVYLEAKDCPGAVKALNDGLARRQPAVMVLAGSMYEEGACLKPNRERAVQLYQRAYESGQTRALSRLVSAHATPGPGQDKAAALWWALKEPAGLPAACRAAEAYRADADRFVEVLKAWPVGRLDACVHVVGVMGALLAGLEFPPDAEAYGLAGKVVVTFEPAAGRIEVQTEEVAERGVSGVHSGELVSDGRSRSARQSLERYVRALGERALARHPRPMGVDPAWRLGATFSFDYLY